MALNYIGEPSKQRENLTPRPWGCALRGSREQIGQTLGSGAEAHPGNNSSRQHDCSCIQDPELGTLPTLPCLVLTQRQYFAIFLGEETEA